MNSKICIINLERRPDRKERMTSLLQENHILNYEFIAAVDGKTLVPTEEIYRLFQNNDFNYRRGVVGCALSHYNLWKRLVDDPENNYYVILEDDVTFCSNFKEKLGFIVDQIMEKNISFCSIGGHLNKKLNENIAELEIYKTENDGYVEGLLGYILTKEGAKHILRFIYQNSIYRAIDHIVYTAFCISSDMHIHKLNELLVMSLTYQMEDNPDTDIQTDYDCLDFNF